MTLSNIKPLRYLFAAIFGILIGSTVLTQLQRGLIFRFPEEFQASNWGLLIWGEHWAFCVLYHVASFLAGGFVAGLISRKKFVLFGVLVTILPAIFVCLLFGIYLSDKPDYLFNQTTTRIFYFICSGEFPDVPMHISIGNKIALTIIGITALPFGICGARAGVVMSVEYSKHFDSRAYTLLGIKWYHYLWIPFILILIITQIGYIAPYAFVWIKAVIQSGAGLFARIIPFVFAAILYCAFALMFTGLNKAYLALAGFENNLSKGKTALTVLKYGVGLQAVSWLIQTAAEYAHYWILRLLS